MRFFRKHGRKFIVYGFYLLLFSMLQVTLSGRVVPYGYMPDLGLVFVVVCGYLFGRDDGMVIGLLTGLLRDNFSGRVLGLGMLIFMFIGLMASALLINLFQRKMFLVLVQVVLMSVFYHTVLVLLTYLFPMLPDQVYNFGQLVQLAWLTLPQQLLVNTVVAVPILLALRFLGPYPRQQQKRGLQESESGDHVWRMT